jgi:autotransporter-associated beta strand protein
VQLQEYTDGATAHFIMMGNSHLDLAGHSKSFAPRLGSIEGDGIIYMGDLRVLIGGLGRNTIFSGLLADAGPGGSTHDHAVLEKVGTGTLALSGANTYSGGTTVSEGVLVAANTTGSATGPGSVTVEAGTLGGSGIVSGAVTVGTGTGAGAFLGPAHGMKKQATLTIQKAVTFNADATYACTFLARRINLRTDEVIANGVTINAGASFSLAGRSQGRIPQGTVLTVISNTAAAAISGAFSNLADGATVTVGHNTFQANYEGGDGNDLTLTVVP